MDDLEDDDVLTDFVFIPLTCFSLVSGLFLVIFTGY